jgi:hypothetical protein
MNTPPAQVTEAHRELIREILLADDRWTTYSLGKAAQLIADSEALAVAGQNAVISEWLNRAATVTTERDRLRAEIERWRDSNNRLREEMERQAQRAEKSEAILGKVQELHGCSQEMVVHWCEHAASRSLALDAVQAELTRERARP